jgi:hypothetical protein
METKTEQHKRDIINAAAGVYLSDQEEGDYYDAYLKLKKEEKNGNEDDLAAHYVEVWQPVEYLSVKELLEMIESSVDDDLNKDNTPQFMFEIDWELLREQKEKIIDLADDEEHKRFTPEEITVFDGIIHLIDAIQDYAVDECEFPTQEVFGYSLDEEDENDNIEDHEPVIDDSEDEFEIRELDDNDLNNRPDTFENDIIY